jgi:enoyl-CoA hydratase/carnithine racemase
VPTGAEAVDIGLATHLAPHEDLLDAAQELAESWIAEGKSRSFRGGIGLDELKEVNAKESVGVADSFLSASFMDAQIRFLSSRKKHGPAAMFFVLRHTRFLWSKFM